MLDVYGLLSGEVEPGHATLPEDTFQAVDMLLRNAFANVDAHVVVVGVFQVFNVSAHIL